MALQRAVIDERLGPFVTWFTMRLSAHQVKQYHARCPRSPFAAPNSLLTVAPWYYRALPVDVY